MTFFVNSVLYSYAQIFFSNRRWLGLGALVASMFVPDIGLMSLFGVVLSNLVAVLLKFERNKIESGVYGFNGILFGAATTYYFELSYMLLFLIPVFIIITFFIAAVLENYLAVAFNLPGLSLPFIVTLFIFLIFLGNYDNLVPVLKHNPLVNFEISNRFLDSYFRSMAFILFQPSVVTGIVITLLILMFSRVLFLLSIAAFTVSYFVTGLILYNQADSLVVVAGFNSVLTAFALGGSLVITGRKSFFLALISVVVSVIITGFFFKLLSGTGLPVLVLPFNFIVLSTLYSLKFRQEHSDITLLYFKPGNPEENFYFHQSRKSRFENFKSLFPELPVFGEWRISQAHDGEYTHKDKWRYAWDFVITDSDGKQFSDEGLNLSDYYCYKIPVVAPIEGKIVKVIDSIPDNEVGKANIEKNWGNTIIIEHQLGLYSALSHLAPNSAKVKEGEIVKKGQVLGLCGNSGRSPYPHLHFQFQVTDKLGDHTHKFPFAHYIENINGKTNIKSFDYPLKDGIVQNLDSHKTIKSALEFPLGRIFKCEFDTGSEKVEETWEVKVDIYNAKYIESDKDARAYIYFADKVFYFSSFSGEKDSALYYFYLLASRVPLTYKENLVWSDFYNPSLLPVSFVDYLLGFLLPFGIKLNARADFELFRAGNDFKLKTNITLSGEGILKFINRNFDGDVSIDSSGDISEFTFNQPTKKAVVVKIIKQ